MRLSLRLACSLSLACCLGSAWSMPPVTIVDQGRFAAGGTVIEAKSAYDPYHPKAEAQTLHGDHAIVSYQVPSQARALPLVFLHGAGLSGGSAMSRQCQKKHGSRTNLHRSRGRLLFRAVSNGIVAEVQQQISIPAKCEISGSVLPPDDAQYGAIRREGQRECFVLRI